MPLRTLASLAVAILLGLVAVLLVRGVLMSRQAAGPAVASDGVSVVVAALPIERGVALKPAMLKTVKYPRDAVPVGAFQSVEALVGKDAPPRTTLRALTANEPLMPAKLSGAGGKTNLSGAVTPGMRAVSVKSSDVAGVGGFVLPGDRVDILLTRVVGKGESSMNVTQILAENAMVLGVDQTSDLEADKPIVAKAVTVEVTPDQAQAISLGHAVGDVSLSLRQLTDDGVLVRKATTESDLGLYGRRVASSSGGGAAPARRASAPARPPSNLTEVRVTRGVETSGYQVGRF